MGGSTTSSTTNSYDPVASMASMYTALNNESRANELFGIYKDSYLPYDQAAMAANTQLLSGLTQLTQQEIDLNSELNPTRAAATKSALEEAMRDIEKNRPLRDELRTQQLNELAWSQPVAEKFYQEALNGITPQYEQRMGQATSDVAQAYANSANDTAMSLARMGVDPTSGKALAALSGMGSSRAKDTALARTSARDTERNRVETESWNRLTTGMNARTHATSGQWSPDYGSVAAGGMPYMSSPTSFASTTNPLSSSSQFAGISSSALSSLANRVTSSETSKTSDGSGFASALGMLGGAAIGKWSSARFKTDVRPVDEVDVAVMPALNPVAYRYKHDPSNDEHLGFIAEELADLLPDVVFFDDRGQPEAVDYGKLTVMLCLENQRLRAALEGRS